MSIVLEIDDKVRGSLGGVTDWNSMLYRRQLTGALFREGTDGSPRPGLLTVVDIPDDQTMIAAVSEGARCASGASPTVTQLAQALYELSRKRSEFFLFGLLSRIRVRNRYLEITSRVPGIDIAQLMASPQFGIQGEGNKSTADFRVLRDRANERLLFHPITPGGDRSRTADKIEVVVSRSPEHALDMFRGGEIDMTCPTSLSQSVWKEWSRNGRVENLRSNPRMLIGVSIQLPQHLRPMYDAFDCCIDRTRHAQSVYGNIYPASNWFEIWDYATPPATFLSGYTGENYVKADVRKYNDRFADLNAPLVIEYADFSPNRELAAELGRQLSKITGCSVLTREIDYSILLSNPRQTHAVRLVLRFFPWAHPAAMLYPSFAHSRSKRLLGTLRPDPADLSDAYRRQQQLQGEIVVGGLRSAMLTRLEAFESPPTGWFDFSDLLRQKAR